MQFRWRSLLTALGFVGFATTSDAQTCSSRQVNVNGATGTETTFTSSGGATTIVVVTDSDGRVLQSTETNNITGDMTSADFQPDYGMQPSAVPDPSYHAKFQTQREFELWEPSHESYANDNHSEAIRNNASMVKQQCGV